MTRRRRSTALLSTGALLAAPVVLLAAPAHADADRSGACGGGSFEYSVERDDGRFEIELELEDVKPGSRWKVTLRHDGNRYYQRTLRADDDGDLDVERSRKNTRGKDAFKFRLDRVKGSAACTRTITLT